MSTNLIDSMSETEAKALLNDICNEMGTGGKARTHSTIMVCIGNAIRRSRCLGRIENYLTVTEIDEDGEKCEWSKLNWGETPEQYIETFKKAL